MERKWVNRKGDGKQILFAAIHERTKPSRGKRIAMCITKILYKRLNFERRKIRAGMKIFECMIADSFSKQMLGLMHRKSIKKNEGMLFMFGRDGSYPIWMMNMKFPIDIVWIDKGCRVVDIEEDAIPCKSLFECKSYYPRKKSRYVLEINSGEAKRNMIKIGSKITL